MLTNIINKFVPQNPNHIRVFFNVDAPKGLAAGVMSLYLLDESGKKIHSHRVRSSAKAIGHKSHFYLDVKKADFDQFKTFSYTFTSFTLKKTTGTGEASKAFEDLSSEAYIQKNLKKLQKVL